MVAVIRSRWRRLCADDRAGIATMGALLFPILIGCTALAIDVSTVFTDRRRTQSAADLAAVVAASNIAVAKNAAVAVAVQNRFPASAVDAVELGIYTPNPALNPQARFVAGSSSTNANAVRVTMKSTTPLYFGRFVTGWDQLNISTNAIAARSAMASFSIGSRTVGLDNGMLNALLGKMLGSNIALSVSDYNALANTRIDLFDFWSGLATRINTTAVNYDSLLSGSAKVGDLVIALQRANSSSSLTGILNGLVATLGSLTTATPLSSIASLGPYSSMPIGQKPQVSAAASALDLLSAVAQAANGTNQIASAIALNLPGIASASVTVAIGEKPQRVSSTAIGPTGVFAQTAQTRVQIALQLTGTPTVPTYSSVRMATSIALQLTGTPTVPLVNVPIYLEVARGTATLNNISCGYPSVTTSTVALGVTPGLVDAWIGTVSAGEFRNFAAPPNPSAATMVNLSPVTVTGRAHAMMGNTTPVTANFNYPDVQALTKKTVTTTNFVTSLMASLLGSLALNVNVGPLGVPIPGLAGSVTGIISGAAPSIDRLLLTVLTTLGIGIGQADVWVNGIRCDGAVLVN